MEASEIVESFVKDASKTLVSNTRLSSLCGPALRRLSRDVFLRHFVAALSTLSKSLRRRAKKPQEKAVAWMLKGCGTAVAYQVCESISPEQKDMNILLSVLDEDPVDNQIARERRLREFLSHRFPTVELPREVVLSVQSLSDSSTDIGPVQSEDDESYLDIDIFANVKDVEQILSTGPHLEDMCVQLQHDLFPIPTKVIEDTLRKHVAIDLESRSIVVIIEWQVLEYFDAEHITPDNIDSIFTVNGSLDCASVSRMGNYMSGVWSSGKELFDMLKFLCSRFLFEDSKKLEQGSLTAVGRGIEIQLFPRTVDCGEQAFVKLTGSFDEMNDRLQQLAWLAATLRSHFDGQLTVSEIDFEALEIKALSVLGQVPNIKIFRIAPFGPEKLFLADGNINAQCWTSILPESVLAYGFPLLKTNRPADALGLEVPFNIMAALAGVKYPVLLKEGIILAGGSNMLMPQSIVGDDDMQWHFYRLDNWLERVTKTRSRNKMSVPRLDSADWAKITSARSFLGYCNNAEVLLGTSQFEHTMVSESEVSTMSKLTFDFAHRTFKVDVNGRGIAIDTEGVAWKFNRGETAQIKASDTSLDERVRHSAASSALLYDRPSCTAFLVSELSVVLELVTTYVYNESNIKRAQIPLADASADGGRAAEEAIKRANNLVVPFANGSDRRYTGIVHDFLDIVEQRKTQTYVNRQVSGTNDSGASGLNGWDHACMQAQKYEFWEHEIRYDNTGGGTGSEPMWWELFKNFEALIISTQLLKSPIRNTKKNRTTQDRKGFNCRAWDDVPRGHHLLLTTMPQLELYKDELCRNPRRYASRYMLSDEMAWARPTTSRLFEPDVCHSGGTCNPIQTMIKVNNDQSSHAAATSGNSASVYSLKKPEKKTKMTTIYLQHPGPIEPSGGVLFADDPTVFQNRQCWSDSPSASSTLTANAADAAGAAGLAGILSGRNYLFIAASIAAMALIYLNFWFFLLSMALFGLTYAAAS